jgi:hypothetical protein
VDAAIKNQLPAMFWHRGYVGMGCPRLYFFALRGEQTSRAASRRGVRPGGAFYFRTPNHGTPSRH